MMIKQAYRIESVLPAEPPTHAEGSDWFCYTITQGPNVIHGYRRGPLDTVTAAVEQIVIRLNDRRQAQAGRVHLVLTPKRPT